MAGLWIETGNHRVTGDGAAPVRSATITVLHAPVRSRAALAQRGDHGRRLQEADEPAGLGWHVRALASELTAVEELWRANSSHRGALEVGGVRRPLERDDGPVSALRPHVPSRLAARRGRTPGPAPR